MGQNPEALKLPFLARDMLQFEDAASFDLELVYSSLFNVALEVTGMTREGIFKFDFLPGVAGTVLSETFRVPDIPIWVAVRQKTAATGMNDQYCMLYLRINQTRVQLLCQGFVGTLYGINWPNQVPIHPLQERGRYDIIQSTNPPANTEWSITIPANQWWKVMQITVTLVTDATAANRRVALSWDDGSGANGRILSAATQIASQTVIYTWFDGAAVIDDQVGLRQNAPLPAGLLLPPASVISSVTTNRQAGDDWAIAAMVGEVWFSPAPNF